MTFYTALMMVMGDSIVPANAEEYLISSLITISGIVANACIFASIASYASQLSAEAVEHKRQMTSLRRSIKALHLAPRLAQRVVRYYEYIFARHRNFSVQRLLDELPEVFQRRCAMSVHEAKLRRFAPFETADQGLISELATKLQPEVYMPEAFILTAGRVYECAYFIDRGLVQLTWGAGSRDMVNMLTIDDYFGEISLFVEQKLAYTARSVTHLDSFRLDRVDFMTVLRAHPADACQVGDELDKVMNQKLATQVRHDLYVSCGLQRFLAHYASQFNTLLHWRPMKGLAEKIKALASKPEFRATLSRVRARGLQSHSRSSAAGRAGEGMASGSVVELRQEVNGLKKGQVRMEEKLERLTNLLMGGGTTTRTSSFRVTKPSDPGSTRASIVGRSPVVLKMPRRPLDNLLSESDAVEPFDIEEVTSSSEQAPSAPVPRRASSKASFMSRFSVRSRHDPATCQALQID